ncbi:MAG: acyl-CoA thioesterase [Pseudomonadota bacterium]
MKYYSRHLVKPEDLNPSNRLFGGTLLAWIDEEAAIFAGCQLGTSRLVTRHISAIDFVGPARAGDVIEFGLEVAALGSASITVRCSVRNKLTHEEIVGIERIVFVHLDADGRPAPHGQAPRKSA